MHSGVARGAGVSWSKVWLVAMAIACGSPLGAQTFDFETYAGRHSFVKVYDPNFRNAPSEPAAGPGSTDGPKADARFKAPRALAFDPAGNLFVCDTGNHTIRKITPDGIVSTYAGAVGQAGHVDGSLTEARFSSPVGIAIDSDGLIFVADETNKVIRTISPVGVVSTLAGQPGVAGSADGTGGAARFDGLGTIALDNNGVLFVADIVNGLIRRVTRAGAVTTLASVGTGGNALGSLHFVLAVGPDGAVYTVQNKLIQRFGTDGSSTTIAEDAGLYRGSASACFDAAGHLLYTGYGPGQLYRCTLDGKVSELAGLLISLRGTPTYYHQEGAGMFAGFVSPAGIACAPNGDLYLADIEANVIRRGRPLPVVTHARLTNLSVRARIGGADAPTILGFVATGVGQKHFLLRGVGQGLAPFGVSDVARRPQLSVSNSGGRIYQTDRWEGGTFAGHPTKTITPRIGAFQLVGFEPSFIFPTTPTDVDTLLGLPPAVHTMRFEEQLPATDGSFSGTALMEIYDCDVGHDQSRLVNLSARTHVGTGEAVTIAGFVIEGPASLRLLIRGVGPTLATDHGVVGALADPELLLYRGGELLGTNDDWSNGTSDAADAALVGAFPLPAGSKDAAMKVTLPSGAYTVQLRGVNGGTGVGLIELYAMPAP